MKMHWIFNRYMKETDGDGDAGGHSAAPDGDQGADDTSVADDDVKAAAAAVEAEASKMGWTPKDQFKGDPDKWRPADEYVERGRNMLPIVQATVKRQEREIAELRQTTKEFAAHMSQTEQRAYDRALATLKEQRKEAVAAGDGDAFDKADSEIERLKADADKKATKAAPAAADDPVYTEWESRNKAWLDDPTMAEFGEFAAAKMRNSGTRLEGAEFLDAVTKKVKEQFPEKFENPRRAAAPAVEGAGQGARKGGKTFADMPADARAACDRMAKNGFSGDKKGADDFKAQYVKQFFEEV